MKFTQMILAAALGACVSSAALAADLPTRKSPAPPLYNPPPAAFTWGGVYVGAFAGGNWTHVTPNNVTLGVGDPALNANGLTAGGLAGYNWAFNNFVLGGEIEAGYDHRGGSANFFDAGIPSSVSARGSVEGRARGRLGIGWGQFLLFAAGGVTVADLKLTYTDFPNAFSQEIGHWRTGFNVGGGLEWAFNDHWILRGEYIYDRFGSRSYDFLAQNPGGFGNRTARFEESTARAAISYKF